MNTTASLDKTSASGILPPVAEETKRRPRFYLGVLILSVALIGLAFWHSFTAIRDVWGSIDSLYSHAPLIPVISLFFVWRLRNQWMEAPMAPSPWLGYPVLLGGCVLLLLGDFLGFITFVHLALLPVLVGVCLLFLGRHATHRLWFPDRKSVV